MDYFHRALDNFSIIDSEVFRLPTGAVYELSVDRFIRTFTESLLIEYCN
jgi:hypothetical protein